MHKKCAIIYLGKVFLDKSEACKAEKAFNYLIFRRPFSIMRDCWCIPPRVPEEI